MSTRPPHGARQLGIKGDRNRSRQADLAAVRMAAEHQGEAGVGGLPIDLRRVREQDGDGAGGNRACRLVDVVGAVVVGVVYTAEIDLLEYQFSG
ncbi:hypothetical protein AB4043_16665 [Terriglobus sp. YAF25]|uniref:hypothetical protein n=1 Tax=Terriglobus sp. YAF25 TaxID=3233080 RepID=UPI003F94D6E5